MDTTQTWFENEVQIRFTGNSDGILDVLQLGSCFNLATKKHIHWIMDARRTWFENEIQIRFIGSFWGKSK